MFFSSESIYPRKFLVFWGLWTILDIAFAIVASISSSNKDREICLSQNIQTFYLSFYMKMLGILGIIINALNMTCEVNPSHISQKFAILSRGFLILPCLAWAITGIVYLVGVDNECTALPLYAITVSGLVSLFVKPIFLQFSTHYAVLGICKPQRSSISFV